MLQFTWFLNYTHLSICFNFTIHVICALIVLDEKNRKHINKWYAQKEKYEEFIVCQLPTDFDVNAQLIHPKLVR